MKLLFDQNVSFRITKKVTSIFPKAKQVRELGLEDTCDLYIWDYAKANNYTIVTFDADFSDIASIKGTPPKIIWLRTGNMTTDAIAEILKAHSTIINEFVQNVEYKRIACLEIE